MREKEERDEGYIPGSLWIPRGLLEFRISSLPINREKDVVIVYCASGARSILATKTLYEMGYRAISMKGGFMAWVKKGFPVEFK